MKKVAIVQSNYIPWKGYFDMIAAVDEFILYDDMQYTRRDWRNRNQIKTPQGVQCPTMPMFVRGKCCQKIKETEINGSDWMVAHWRYRRALHFDAIWPGSSRYVALNPSVLAIELLVIDAGDEEVSEWLVPRMYLPN